MFTSKEEALSEAAKAGKDLPGFEVKTYEIKGHHFYTWVRGNVQIFPLTQEGNFIARWDDKKSILFSAENMNPLEAYSLLKETINSYLITERDNLKRVFHIFQEYKKEVGF